MITHRAKPNELMIVRACTPQPSCKLQAAQGLAYDRAVHATAPCMQRLGQGHALPTCSSTRSSTRTGPHRKASPGAGIEARRRSYHSGHAYFVIIRHPGARRRHGAAWHARLVYTPCMAQTASGAAPLGLGQACFMRHHSVCTVPHARARSRRVHERSPCMVMHTRVHTHGGIATSRWTLGHSYRHMPTLPRYACDSK